MEKPYNAMARGVGLQATWKSHGQGAYRPVGLQATWKSHGKAIQCNGQGSGLTGNVEASPLPIATYVPVILFRISTLMRYACTYIHIMILVYCYDIVLTCVCVYVNR